MLHYLPQESSEMIPEIKSYIYNFTTAMKTVKNKDGDSNALLDASNDAVFVCTEDGSVIEINHIARQMFSFTSSSDIVGKSFLSMISPEHNSEMKVPCVNNIYFTNT